MAPKPKAPLAAGSAAEGAFGAGDDRSAGAAVAVEGMAAWIRAAASAAIGGGSASFFAAGGGERAATAGAGAAPAVGDADGSSGLGPWAVGLAAVEAARAAAAGAASSAAGFGACAFVLPEVSGGLDGRALTQSSSASGFVRLGEPRGFRAGAGNALTHFGFGGVVALFAAAGAEGFFETLLAAASSPFGDPPSPRDDGSAGLPCGPSTSASGLAAFARGATVFRWIFGMTRSQGDARITPVLFSS